MFRTSNFARLALGAPRFFPAMPVAAAAAPQGAAAVPKVSFAAASDPAKATVLDMNGKQHTVGAVVAHLQETLTKARSTTRSDRGIISAPMLGYNARILVVHCGLEKLALINPKVVLTSHQVAHTWTPGENGNLYRVVRHRSVAVKYTTLQGDDETWYAMPLEESEVVQDELAKLDGIPVAQRVAPCVAEEPDLFPECVSNGVVGCVSQSAFDRYSARLMSLIEPLARSKVTVPSQACA